MNNYKRLTKWEMNKGVKCVKYWQYSQEQIAERLALLEDKIERGELVQNKVVTYINMARSGNKTLVDKALKYDELKAKIENGTLIELPCKVEDDAYFIIKHEEDYVLEEGYVKAISIDKDGIWVSCYYNSGFSYWHKHKDKNLFYKVAEAEAKLKELQGE